MLDADLLPLERKERRHFELMMWRISCGCQTGRLLPVLAVGLEVDCLAVVVKAPLLADLGPLLRVALLLDYVCLTKHNYRLEKRSQKGRR